MSALTNEQKRRLAGMFRAAWEKDPEADGIDADHYRREQVAAAVGKDGLRCCTQLDYARLMAHALHLVGEDGAALEWHLRAETEPKRQAEAVLQRELGRAGLKLEYASAICRRQYRCEIADASPKQIWGLVYTVRNRGAAKSRNWQNRGVAKS